MAVLIRDTGGAGSIVAVGWRVVTSRVELGLLSAREYSVLHVETLWGRCVGSWGRRVPYSAADSASTACAQRVHSACIACAAAACAHSQR